MKMNKLKKGFTLVELLVVMAIIGILMLIGVPRFIKMTDGATTTTLEANSRITLGAMQSYKAEMGTYPTTFGDLVEAGYVSDFTAEGKESPRGATYVLDDTGSGGLVATAPLSGGVTATVTYDVTDGSLTTVTE